MNTSRPASLVPFAVMPNSPACLMRVHRVRTGIRQPDHLRPARLRLDQERREIAVAQRRQHVAQHLAASLGHEVGGVALQRMAEGVVGGDEEPGIAARLHHRAAGGMRQHPGVHRPMHRGRRALRPGQVGGGPGGVDVDLVHLLADAGHRQRDGAVRHVDDHVDLVAVDPLPRQAGTDVRLVLVVAGDDLHRDVAPRGLAVGNPQLYACDGDGSAQVAIDARLVAQNADLDPGGLRTPRRQRHRGGGSSSSGAEKAASCQSHDRFLFPSGPIQPRGGAGGRTFPRGSYHRPRRKVETAIGPPRRTRLGCPENDPRCGPFWDGGA